MKRHRTVFATALLLFSFLIISCAAESHGDSFSTAAGLVVDGDSAMKLTGDITSLKNGVVAFKFGSKGFEDDTNRVFVPGDSLFVIRNGDFFACTRGAPTDSYACLDEGQVESSDRFHIAITFDHDDSGNPVKFVVGTQSFTLRNGAQGDISIPADTLYFTMAKFAHGKVVGSTARTTNLVYVPHADLVSLPLTIGDNRDKLQL